MKDSKKCPYLEGCCGSSHKPELLQEYYNQRTNFHSAANENLLQIKIPNTLLQDSAINSELSRLSSVIPESFKQASSLQFFRHKLLEKIQCQEELHEKCKNISYDYSAETNKQVLNLKETLQKRKNLLKKLAAEKFQQKKVEDEIDALNLSLQNERKNLICWKIKSLQSELKDAKVDESEFKENLNEIERLKGRIERAEQENLKIKEEFGCKMEKKIRFLKEIVGKREKLVEENKSKAKEKKTLLDEIGNYWRDKEENEERLSVDSKHYVNYFEEIQDLQSQIDEYKTLQHSYIADRYSLLEPLKFIENQHLHKSHQLLLSDLDQACSTSSQQLISLDQSLKFSSQQLSSNLSSLSQKLETINSDSISSFKSHYKSITSAYKSLHLNVQKTEILLKTLDAADKALDSFKAENCSELDRN